MSNMRNVSEKNRGRFEIIAEILRQLRTPTRRTNIMCHCNMSTTQSGQYLNLMESKDLIRMNTVEGTVTYQRTEAGRAFLDAYNKMFLLLDPSLSASSLAWQ